MRREPTAPRGVRFPHGLRGVARVLRVRARALQGKVRAEADRPSRVLPAAPVGAAPGAPSGMGCCCEERAARFRVGMGQMRRTWKLVGPRLVEWVHPVFALSKTKPE